MLSQHFTYITYTGNQQLGIDPPANLLLPSPSDFLGFQHFVHVFTSYTVEIYGLDVRHPQSRADKSFAEIKFITFLHRFVFPSQKQFFIFSRPFYVYVYIDSNESI